MHTHTLSLCSAGRQPMLSRTVNHQLQVGWQTPTSEIPSFTPPHTRYSLLLPSLREHQRNFQDKTTKPLAFIPILFITSVILLFLILSSTYATLSLPLYLISSIPRKLSAYTQTESLCLDLGLHWQETFTNLIVHPLDFSDQLWPSVSIVCI